MVYLVDSLDLLEAVDEDVDRKKLGDLVDKIER